jgi:hypothetical protein
MMPVLRPAFGFAFALSALTASGCYVSVEPATRFEGTPETFSEPYGSGTPLHVVSNNGNVKVVAGSASDTAKVTFHPFVMDKDSNEAGARDQMEKDLILYHGMENGELVFRVTRQDGASSTLGADIDVALPSGFDGNFIVNQNNGDIDADLRGGTPTATRVDSTNGSVKISGAAGPLSIKAGTGTASISVAAWSTSNGTVALGNGDLDFSAPANANGSIQAFAKNGVVNDAGVSSSWTSQANSAGSKSYTMGDGMGGNVSLSTDLGDITLSAN